MLWKNNNLEIPTCSFDTVLSKQSNDCNSYAETAAVYGLSRQLIKCRMSANAATASLAEAYLTLEQVK